MLVNENFCPEKNAADALEYTFSPCVLEVDALKVIRFTSVLFTILMSQQAGGSCLFIAQGTTRPWEGCVHPRRR